MASKGKTETVLQLIINFTYLNIFQLKKNSVEQ
jgi:hypothetical protein